MSIIQQAQNMIATWSIDFYGGWSIMDFFYLLLGFTLLPWSSIISLKLRVKSEMLVIIASLLFYIIDPYIGVILALALPYAISLDLPGEYTNFGVSILFAGVAYFVRKIGLDWSEE